MVQKQFFGYSKEGESIDRYVLSNENGMTAGVLSLGCTLTSVVVPTKNGPLDVCLGYDTVQEYETNRTSMGAVCGRFANRIANGTFSLNGVEYRLPINNGPNHLHGGIRGFAYRIWDAEILDEHSVRFSRTSPDGEEGYPGTLRVVVTYALDNDNSLSIRYDAISDADTVLNLTNHAYWNLNGHNAGDAMRHTLTLPASYFCPCDANALVTGDLKSVDGTPFDFRAEAALDVRLRNEQTDEQLRCGQGFDHCYLLDGGSSVVLKGDQSGVSMEITTDMPAIQLYTANHLKQQKGKDGANYAPRNSICLETEQVPDAPNNPQFPSSVLPANKPFVSVTTHRFRF